MKKKTKKLKSFHIKLEFYITKDKKDIKVIETDVSKTLNEKL